jgi:hypothetical protein
VGILKFIFTGEASRLLREQEKVRQKQQGISQAVSKSERASRQSHDNQKRGMDQLVGSVAKYTAMLAGPAGLAAAWKLVGDEAERVIRVQKRAAEAQMTVTQAEQKLLLNLGGSTEAEARQTRDAIKAAADKQNIPLQQAYTAAANVVSAAGGDITKAIPALQVGFQMSPGDAAGMENIAAAAVDLQRSTGMADPYANVGMMQLIGRAARVADPAKQAIAIPRTLSGAGAFGATGEGAGAAFAAIGGGITDPMGERTSTGVIRLAQQLDEFFQGRGGNFAQRVTALQRDTGRAQEFLADASFEGAVEGAVKLLLDPTTDVGRSFQESYQFLQRDPTQFAGVAAQSIGRRGLARGEPVAATERAMSKAEEAMLLENPQIGLLGAMRNRFENVLEASGQSALAGRITGISAKYSALSAPEKQLDALQRLFENRREQLLSTEPEQVRSYTGYGFAIQPTAPLEPREVSDEERKQAEVLGEMLAEIKAQRAAIERMANRETTPDPSGEGE